MNQFEKKILMTGAIKALDYIQHIETRSVAPSTDALENLRAFDEDLPIKGTDAVHNIEFLDEYGAPATMASNGSRYYGFVIGGSHPAALAANWMASAWDQNSGLVATSPINAKIEEVVEKWISSVLPVAKESSVGFVTGVTMANFCALAAARTTILESQGWDVEAKGLFEAPPITVVVGEEAHGSVMKALSMLGLGRERVIRIPTDANGRMRTELLPPLNHRTILCMQAGNVNTGGMDDGRVIAEAKAQGAWVHIDGAFGLWAGASTLKRHLTVGYELADSWATDGHKWLNVPYDSGLVICRNGDHLRRSMSMHGDYLDQSGDRIPYQYTPELSRRARAIDIWAAMRTLGREGIDEMVTRTCAFAEYLALHLQRAGFQILNEVQTNQVLVSFGKDTQHIIKEIQLDGTCWCGGTIWKGQPAMRISVSSVKTSEYDIKKSLTAILKAAGQFTGEKKFQHM